MIIHTLAYIFDIVSIIMHSNNNRSHKKSNITRAYQFYILSCFIHITVKWNRNNWCAIAVVFFLCKIFIDPCKKKTYIRFSNNIKNAYVDYARHVKHTFPRISQPGMTTIYSGVTKTENKLGISCFFRAIHNRYTACRRCTTRIPFPFSVFLPDGRAFVRAKGNVCERQWGLGYNAWQIDCLNRIGFNELHRRASKGRKGTTDGKIVRAPRAKQWKYKDRLRAPRKEYSIRSFTRARVYQLCDESFLYISNVYLVCTVKISSMSSSTNGVYSVRYRRRVTSY